MHYSDPEYTKEHHEAEEPDLKDLAFDLAIKKYGFEINEGNREAVYSIVRLCVSEVRRVIDTESVSAPVVSKMTINRAIASLGDL